MVQQKGRRLQIGRWVIRACLILQCVAITIFAALNLLDERLEKVSLSSMLMIRVDSAAIGYRILLPFMAYVLILSLGVFAAGMLFGEPKKRSLKHLFILTAMTALTLALFTTWQRISWEGRRHRMSSRVESLQVVCDALQKDWPKNDMTHELLGSIMAYPQWNPTTLILLTPMPIDGRFRIAAIDRSKNGVLRFELSSGFETIWLEHRIDSGLDMEFTNGIEQSFVREHYVSLSRGWYLVRYQ
jgi:hypothetical protein